MTTSSKGLELLVGRCLFAGLLTILWNGQATGQSAQLRGQVLQARFDGPVTGLEIPYSIYLPPGYDGGTERYPVVYSLHGLGGSYLGSHTRTVPAAYEAAADARRASRSIIVFTDGYANSWWADSWDGTKPAETNLVYELIPHIDETYRTLADREHRVIEGMSMGGWGAIKFMAKFPRLFRACVTWDAAIHNWDTFSSGRPDLAAEIFNNDRLYFENYSPWPYLAPNALFLQENAAIRIIVGSIKEGNAALRDVLNYWRIDHDYIETSCPHNWPCMLTEEGFWSAVFIDRCTRAPRRADRK